MTLHNIARSRIYGEIKMRHVANVLHFLRRICLQSLQYQAFSAITIIYFIAIIISYKRANGQKTVRTFLYAALF